MQSKIIKQSDDQVVISVSLTDKTLAGTVKETFNRLRPRVKAAGFRVGKAPDNIVERELGLNVIQGEVMESAIGTSYSAAVKDLNINAIAAPKVSLVKFVPYTELEYTAEIAILPPVTLPNISKIKIKRPVPNVGAEQIDTVVEDLRRRLAKRTIANREVKNGDEVVFDFEGTKDGQPVAGASANSHTLAIGSGSFIPGFEAELVGLKSGAQKTFDIKFPDNYASPNLAGQTVRFKVKLHTIYQIDLPRLDDKFASEAGPFKNLAQLRRDIEDRQKQESQAQLDRQFENQVIEKIVDDSKVSVPDSLVDQQMESLRQEFANNLAQQGMDLDKYAKMSGKTALEIDDELRPQAKKRVAAAMVLSEYARTNNLQASEQEVQAELQRIKASYPNLDTSSESEEHDLRNEIYNHLLSRKVMGSILSTIEGA